ncbi:MAG: right-handed parallel beta-helix repeat-containing protein, partial [Planctomycetes bacterium]|nr:right-handed parallel beta-helix repeat-containing protein [Planctomycetota bacterium]
MSSKWHESIGEERRQADLTAQALGQQDETWGEAEAELTPGGMNDQQGEDIREFAREVSTALIESQREPSTELRKKVQQHFDKQILISHTRRYAEMNSNTKTSLKSRTLWLVVAACALVAAVPLGFHWLTDHGQSQSEVTVADNTVGETAEGSSTKMVSADIQDELAQLVEQFNELMDQNRHAEARVIARQAKELAPDEPVTETLVWKSKFVGRVYQQMDIRDRKENAFVETVVTVLSASIPFGDDYNSFRHGDASEWRDLTTARINNMTIDGGAGDGFVISGQAGNTGSFMLATNAGTIDNVVGDSIRITDFPTATIQNLVINAGTGSALSIETMAGLVGDSTVTITDNIFNGDSDPAVDIIAESETSSTLTVIFDHDIVTSSSDAFVASVFGGGTILFGENGNPNNNKLLSQAFRSDQVPVTSREDLIFDDLQILTNGLTPNGPGLTKNGITLNFVHVDSADPGNGGGLGTFEDPLTSLVDVFANSNADDVIIVHGGTIYDQDAVVLTSTPFPIIPNGIPMIVPFVGDVDTRVNDSAATITSTNG